MTYRVHPGPHPACTRLDAVLGDGSKKNDVLFHGPIGAAEPDHNVIFFPGDVQEYSEVMMRHYDHGKYLEWNLESTAERLSHRFPNSHIFVIKPKVMQLQTYSVFSNFVKSDPIGVPTFGDGQGSWRHLQALMENAIAKIHEIDQTRVEVVSEVASSIGTWSVTETLPSCGAASVASSVAESDESFDSAVTSIGPIGPSIDIPTTLIGFSKGCVVVNQLIHDITEAQKDPKTRAFLEHVNHIYWLDGGHNGGSNTWIVNDRIVDKMTSLKCQYHVHVTPYQIKDNFRKYIGIEHKRFVDKLKARNLKVDSQLHFRGQERSLENHFKVLEAF